jgi:hypothetical protein
MQLHQMQDNGELILKGALKQQSIGACHLNRVFGLVDGTPNPRCLSPSLGVKPAIGWVLSLECREKTASIDKISQTCYIFASWHEKHQLELTQVGVPVNESEQADRIDKTTNL